MSVAEYAGQMCYSFPVPHVLPRSPAPMTYPDSLSLISGKRGVLFVSLSQGLFLSVYTLNTETILTCRSAVMWLVFLIRRALSTFLSRISLALSIVLSGFNMHKLVIC